MELPLPPTASTGGDSAMGGQPGEGPVEDPLSQCLSLEWVFGLNKDFKGVVHNLSDGARKCLFYFVAHTAIVYDVTNAQQKLLQGHRNPIIASCMSPSRRFVATADAGEDSTLIVWDTYSYLPVKSISIEEYGGVLACDISSDAMYIATLSKGSPQRISLWSWTSEECMAPEHTSIIHAKDEQSCIRFSPDDPRLLVTNGAKRVIFWSWAEGSWKYYSPPVTAKEVKQVVGNFTQSMFIPDSSMAASGTADGDVILWDSVQSDKLTKSTDKTLLKVVRVHTGGVTFLSSVGSYIVTGGVDGHVRFLDHKLRLVAWFEELNGGAIISVSFDKTTPSETAATQKTSTSDPNETYTGSEFQCADFVVSTANAMIIDVGASSFTSTDTEYQRGKLLMQGQDQPIMAIAAHPTLPRLAIGGYSGNLHLWEYTTHKVLLLSLFRNLLIHSLAFDPKALYLGVGFTNGVVKILDANSLEEMQSFKPKSPDCITQIVFSHDSQFFATADAEGCVGLYRYTHRAQDPRKPIEWVYIGRHRAHRAAINGLQFGIVPYGAAARLISLGEDKRLVEYNLVDSDIETGVKLACANKVTQGAVPTALLWTSEQLVHDEAMPRAKDGRQVSAMDMLLIATNEYKLKVHMTDLSRQCIKTVLGPTFGGPVSNVLVVPAQPGAQNRCLVYATEEKVVGLIRLPLDGDPRASMGLLAHPLEISSICVSYDGKYFFTAGGRDCSVHQWAIDCDALKGDSDRGVDHFIDVIEGGREGAFMKEIIDYFYYAQIRAQGEETTKKRKIELTIPFTQVPNLMRALGYYPSEREIQNMTFEMMTQFGEPGGSPEDITNIRFETFIQLYVNHRPVFGISKRNIEAAFAAIGADPVTGVIDRDVLFNLLKEKGEPLHGYEIEDCLKSLLGDDVTIDWLDDKLTAKAFGEGLLGFEDYEEGADAEEGNSNIEEGETQVSP